MVLIWRNLSGFDKCVSRLPSKWGTRRHCNMTTELCNAFRWGWVCFLLSAEQLFGSTGMDFWLQNGWQHMPRGKKMAWRVLPSRKSQTFKREMCGKLAGLFSWHFHLPLRLTPSADHRINPWGWWGLGTVKGHRKEGIFGALQLFPTCERQPALEVLELLFL